MTVTAKKLVIMLPVTLVCFCLTQSADACSVCFGDPDSPMARGAAAGVMVLGGVISSVLLGGVCISAVWMRRSRLLQRGEDL